MAHGDRFRRTESELAMFLSRNGTNSLDRPRSNRSLSRFDILSGESMTSKFKNKHRAPRKAKMGPLLDRLKSGEAATVLRRLLQAHPDLSSEADGIARS